MLTGMEIGSEEVYVTYGNIGKDKQEAHFYKIQIYTSISGHCKSKEEHFPEEINTCQNSLIGSDTTLVQNFIINISNLPSPEQGALVASPHSLNTASGVWTHLSPSQVNHFQQQRSRMKLLSLTISRNGGLKLTPSLPC
ncbi:hypothetical protein ACOMHN_020615 [Nucella lapillus]